LTGWQQLSRAKQVQAWKFVSHEEGSGVLRSRK
jgi:hypothetical protein